MNAPRFALTTPRRLVVGLLFFGAAVAGCHRQAPPAAPTPAPVTPPPARQQPAPAVTITDGNSLVRAMRDAYPNWYKTLTFKQAMTITRGSGAPLEQTWYEAALLPGRLRIDTDLAAKTERCSRTTRFSVSSAKLCATPAERAACWASTSTRSRRAHRGAASARLRSLADPRNHARASGLRGSTAGDTTSAVRWQERSAVRPADRTGAPRASRDPVRALRPGGSGVDRHARSADRERQADAVGRVFRRPNGHSGGRGAVQRPGLGRQFTLGKAELATLISVS